jgi:hypothetical protein
VSSKAKTPARRRFWAGLVRARGLFPLTNLGLGVAAAGTLCFFKFALPRVDYVLELVGLFADALVIAAVLIVLPTTLSVHRAFKRNMGRGEVSLFEAQRGFASILRMPSFRWFPLVELRWSWIEPEGFTVDRVEEAGQWVERVEAKERAHAPRIVRRFVIEDAFGLARIVLLRTEDRTVRALPWVGKLNVSPMLRSHTGGDDLPHPMGELDGDRVDMRGYIPGDPLRLVLWKVFARTQELMVRTPERAISPALRIIAYLPSAPADDPAAAAARVAIEQGLLGDDWTFSADGALHPASEHEGALELVTRSRAVRGTDAADAAGLATFLETSGDVKNRLILFVPAIPGPWLARTAEALRRRNGPVTALIAAYGIEAEHQKEDRLERWIKLPAPRSERAIATPDELMEVARTLAQAGAHVAGVERPTGRTLNLGGIRTHRIRATGKVA